MSNDPPIILPRLCRWQLANKVGLKRMIVPMMRKMQREGVLIHLNNWPHWFASYWIPQRGHAVATMVPLSLPLYYYTQTVRTMFKMQQLFLVSAIGPVMLVCCGWTARVKQFNTITTSPRLVYYLCWMATGNDGFQCFVKPRIPIYRERSARPFHGSEILCDKRPRSLVMSSDLLTSKLVN